MLFFLFKPPLKTCLFCSPDKGVMFIKCVLAIRTRPIVYIDFGRYGIGVSDRRGFPNCSDNNVSCRIKAHWKRSYLCKPDNMRIIENFEGVAVSGGCEPRCAGAHALDSSLKRASSSQSSRPDGTMIFFWKLFAPSLSPGLIANLSISSLANYALAVGKKAHVARSVS